MLCTLPITLYTWVTGGKGWVSIPQKHNILNMAWVAHKYAGLIHLSWPRSGQSLLFTQVKA